MAPQAGVALQLLSEVDMPYESINEPVQVGVVFSNNIVKPKWFVWNDKKYTISEITYTWHVKQGETTLLYFSVSDGSSLYEICFNQKSLKWCLEKVFIE